MKAFFSLLGENRKFFCFTLFVGIIFSAIGVAVPALSGGLITAVVTDSGNRGVMFGAFLLISFFQICFAELDEYAGNTFKTRQKSYMRRKAFHAFTLDDGKKREEISAFVSFVNNDIPSITEQYFMGTIDIIKCTSIILFSAMSLLFIHWVLALVIVSVSVLIVILPNTMRKKGGEARKSYSAILGKYNTVLQSALDGLSIVKAYCCQKYVARTVDSADQKAVRAELTLLKHHLTVQGITIVLQVAKTASVLLIGIHLISKGEINVGSLVAVIQLAEVISAPIEVLAYLRHGRNEVLPILVQYRAMAESSPKLQSGRTELSGAFRQLSIDHLFYQAGDLAILKDVSASFGEGKKYLITGESGSGKSTLLRLIAQIGDIDYSGCILYNQHEIRTISYDTYYRKVCPVFQEPYLFYATLEENICLGRQIPQEIYYEIIKKLNLGYLLDRYQNQEITPEIMETLSGGERQRVVLARAMVGRPSVYLLDEVTSALDQGNAEIVERLLLNEEATVIHICHKPNPAAAAQYDGIYEMVGGVLIAVC